MPGESKEYVDHLQAELDRLSESLGKSVTCDQIVLKDLAQRLDELLRKNQTNAIANMISSNLVGVFIVGQGPVLQYANVRAKQILGSEAEIRNLLGADGEVFYLADQMTACAEHLPWLRALRGQHVDGDLLFLRPKADSGDKWISICALPQRQKGEEITAAFVLLVDTTDQIQSEQRLRQIKQAVHERRAASPNRARLSGLLAAVDKRRALLADDMQINQWLLTAQLNKLNFTVHLANNGKEAVEAAAHNKYDIIILDCEMPILDGYMAAKAIRAGERQSSAHTPILALTDYTHGQEETRFITAGADACTRKGADIRRFENAIKSLLKDEADNGHVNDNGQGASTADLPELAYLEELYGKENFDDILSLFIASVDSLLDLLSAGLSERDARAAHYFAYSLRGPALLLHANKMASLCQDIAETAIRAKWFDAEDKFADLRAAFNALHKKLQPGSAGGGVSKVRKKTKTISLSLDILEQRVGKPSAIALAKAFKEDTKNALTVMAGALRRYDYENLQSEAQKLAGCCAAIFIAKDLRNNTKALEALCCEEHVDWIETAHQFDSLSKSYNEILAQIEGYLKTNEAPVVGD